MSSDEILTVKETAVLLKTTRQQVRKMIVNEELPAVKVGREWRVYGDNVFEKCGINRDGAGEVGKPRYFNGKRHF